MGRILTIEIEIIDREKAQWIWDIHTGDDDSLGIAINSIYEGPIDQDEDDE